MSDWTDMSIGAAADLLPGYPFKSAQYTDDPSAIRLVRGDNIAQANLRWDGVKRWPVALLDGLDQYLLREGDVVLAMDRPWIEAGLKFARVGATDSPSLLVQRVTRLRARPGVSQEFLFWVICTEEFSHYAQAVQTGTAVPHISGSQIAAFPFRLPPLEEQLRIAAVLDAIENKAAHNRHLAQQLEELIRLRSKALLDRAETRCPLSSVASFINGKAFTKDATGDGRPILRIKELKSGVNGASLRSDISAPPENIASPFDLLFSWSGSLDVYRWDGPEALINQHIFKVVPAGDYPTWLVEQWLRQCLPKFQAIAADKATTMGHIQRRHLDEALVGLPRDGDLKGERSMLDAADALRAGLAIESRNLRALGRLLLPKLMRGRIRLPETYEPKRVVVEGVAQAAESAA
jgi:type I restriction enzyme S subunit